MNQWYRLTQTEGRQCQRVFPFSLRGGKKIAQNCVRSVAFILDVSFKIFGHVLGRTNRGRTR